MIILWIFVFSDCKGRVIVLVCMRIWFLLCGILILVEDILVILVMKLLIFLNIL